MGVVGGSSESLGSLDAELVRTSALSAARRGQLCDSGLPDPDMCVCGVRGGGGRAGQDKACVAEGVCLAAHV